MPCAVLALLTSVSVVTAAAQTETVAPPFPGGAEVSLMLRRRMEPIGPTRTQGVAQSHRQEPLHDVFRPRLLDSAG